MAIVPCCSRPDNHNLTRKFVWSAFRAPFPALAPERAPKLLLTSMDRVNFSHQLQKLFPLLMDVLKMCIVIRRRVAYCHFPVDMQDAADLINQLGFHSIPGFAAHLFDLPVKDSSTVAFPTRGEFGISPAIRFNQAVQMAFGRNQLGSIKPEYLITYHSKPVLELVACWDDALFHLLLFVNGHDHSPIRRELTASASIAFTFASKFAY